MAINSATDLSRLQRDSEAASAARSGFAARNAQTGDFARMLQDQAIESPASARTATGRGEAAAARPSSGPGDSDKVTQTLSEKSAAAPGVRADVEQRNAASRQVQQGLQQARRERTDLESHRAEAARAETASAGPTSAAVRKPNASQASGASTERDPSADVKQEPPEAPATMAAWLRHAARANRGGHAPAAGDPATAGASDDVPPRSDDSVTVASTLTPGAVAQDPAAALAASGAVPPSPVGAASQVTLQSAGHDGVAGSGPAARRGGNGPAGLDADGTSAGSDAAGALQGTGHNGATEPGLDARFLPIGAQADKWAAQDRPASLAAGGDGSAFLAAGESGAAPADRRGRLGGEALSDVRAADLGQAPAAVAWDTRLALDGLKSSAEMSAAVPIDTPVQDEGFGEHVGLTVGKLARVGVESATLQLNPAEMGPVAVSIALVGEQARVNFTADREDTRKALEASMSQLDAALRADGMVLVEAQVAPSTPAPDAGGADTGTASGQGYPQGGPADGGRNGAGQGSGAPRNRWAAAESSPAVRQWDLRVDAADGRILGSSVRPSGTSQLDLYA